MYKKLNSIQTIWTAYERSMIWKMNGRKPEYEFFLKNDKIRTQFGAKLHKF